MTQVPDFRYMLVWQVRHPVFVPFWQVAQEASQAEQTYPVLGNDPGGQVVKHWLECRYLGLEQVKQLFAAVPEHVKHVVSQFGD